MQAGTTTGRHPLQAVGMTVIAVQFTELDGAAVRAALHQQAMLLQAFEKGTLGRSGSGEGRFGVIVGFVVMGPRRQIGRGLV